MSAPDRAAAPVVGGGDADLLAALTLLWERYENGVDVFEQGFEDSSPIGHAVALSEDEENRILAVVRVARPTPRAEGGES